MNYDQLDNAVRQALDGLAGGPKGEKPDVGGFAVALTALSWVADRLESESRELLATAEADARAALRVVGVPAPYPGGKGGNA